MNDIVNIEGIELAIKEYNGVRVVTFKDIDTAHRRPDGTANRNFRQNRGRFVEGRDFFRISAMEYRRSVGDMDSRQQNDIVLITEFGYLMLVKSLTDDLAWKVQLALVKDYFRDKRNVVDVESLSPELQYLVKVEKRLDGIDNKIQFISDAFVYRPDSWRKDAAGVIRSVAYARGGIEQVDHVYKEIYRLMDTRLGIKLERRLTNKKKRMSKNGATKTAINNANKMDVIEEDDKLIECFMAIVKEFAAETSILDRGLAL